MKELSILAGAFCAVAVAAIAAEDPIAVRKALMQANGNAAAIAGGVMKGELDYNPVVGRSVIASMHAAAVAFGDYFPEGTADDERTTAAPKIWEDMAGFQEKLAGFQEVTAAAVEASGENGPPDSAAFQAAMVPVLDTCKGCHETYRVEK